MKPFRGRASSLEYSSRLFEKRRCVTFTPPLPMLLFALELVVKLFLVLGSFCATEFLQIRRIRNGVEQLNSQFRLSSHQIRHLIQSLPTSIGVVDGHKDLAVFDHRNLLVFLSKNQTTTFERQWRPGDAVIMSALPLIVVVLVAKKRHRSLSAL